MESTPTTPAARLPWRRSPAVAAVLGWVFPGLGHLYVGRPFKGALFLVAILPTFLLGWYLTGFAIVDPAQYGLDFAAQALLGAPTLAALEIGANTVLDRLPPFFDVGRLYVLVAGLLNLVSVYDGVGESILHNRRVLERRRAIRLEMRERAEEAGPGGDAVPEETP